MQTMIEKLSRDLATYQFGNPDSWRDQVTMVRFILDAIRDPTPEMWRAVVKDGGMTSLEAAEFYTAMIDAARTSTLPSRETALLRF